MQPVSRDDAKRRIAGLAELFARDINIFKSTAYNETQTRLQFIKTCSWGQLDSF